MCLICFLQPAKPAESSEESEEEGDGAKQTVTEKEQKLNKVKIMIFRFVSISEVCSIVC